MDLSDRERGERNHTHGEGVQLEDRARKALKNGITELLRMTEAMEFVSTPSERCPFPLALAVYPEVPEVEEVRDDIRKRIPDDPVSVLEHVLVLLELLETNQDDASEHILEDRDLTRMCFSSKRANGWIRAIGDTDSGEVERAVNGRWQFRFFSDPPRPTGIYSLLNVLGRYAFVYGRIEYGDFHALSHFVEDHTPGLLICRGKMTDLELTLSLAGMKMGLPAIVSTDYPFPLGRTLRIDDLIETVESVVAFPNIRRMVKTPGIPQLPHYCDPRYSREEVEGQVTWGATDESFYIVKNGEVDSPGFVVKGEPSESMGVVVTIDPAPMDPFGCDHIEQRIARDLSAMKGVSAKRDDGKLIVRQGAGVDLDPQRIGEVLWAAVRHEFPKLENVGVEVVFDERSLAERRPSICEQLALRTEQMESASEESVDHFCMCVGCSPFAPDHVCVLTPERRPQCGRPYGMIRAGALYTYDDMSNIHHRALHRDINSYQLVEKGKCLDPDRGEWEGVNKRAAELTGGRTTRIQLHCLDEVPHTGCGCFRLVMFKTEKPRCGIGIMDRAYTGRAADERNWGDLHYSLAGKQTPGLAGAAPSYLSSPKFLKAHGGWESVVWVSPRIAEIVGDNLPEHVQVGEEE